MLDVFIDLRFRRFVTPLIIEIINIFFVALVLVGWALLSWLLFKGPFRTLFIQSENGAGWGIDGSNLSNVVIVWGLCSVVYLLCAWLGLLFLRLALESIMVLFRIEEHLDDIAHK